MVQERQAGDKTLSCSEILDEVDDARRFENKARNAKGVTGTNVAAALFWWPGLLSILQ